MPISDGFPLFMVVFFGVFYITVFIMSVVGNVWVIVTCYKTIRRRYRPLMWLVANLASADLFFTFLTILDLISSYWHWVGGNNACKLQGFLVEATYSTSITTLVVISYQRMKATIDPFNARIGGWVHTRQYRKLLLIWVMCLAVCSPLVRIYRVETQANGELICNNFTWGDIGRQIYYSLHVTLFFIVPLLYMIFAQAHMHHALRTRGMPMGNSFIEKSHRRHKKVAKTLAALTVVFVICWSPFMITRTLIYFHLVSPGLVWKASQLLICLNAALDPLFYGYFGGHLKATLRRVLKCNCTQRREYNLTRTVCLNQRAGTNKP